MKLEKTIHYGSREALIENLKDAGCSRKYIIKCLEQGSETDLLKVLEEHRKYLLDRLHKEEKQIECLDYLVYQIRRNQNNS